MKFLVEQNELLGGLQIVQRAISSRSTLPILSGIYLSCEHNILRLRATDLEIGIDVLFLSKVKQKEKLFSRQDTL